MLIIEPLYMSNDGATTFSIMTLSITTFSIMPPSIMPLSITKNKMKHSAECKKYYYAECLYMPRVMNAEYYK